jgi:hypothetical protein
MIIKFLKQVKKNYLVGKRFLNDKYFIETSNSSNLELQKKPYRFDVINFIIESLNKSETIYLEIGVRYPEANFNKINSKIKYSVDPGIEFVQNPVDFKITSDIFFEELRSGAILHKDIKFDVIFIDGLHEANQVERDIKNALDFINDDGFIVLHDCNPPTEFHARESYNFELSPAKWFWNGTTWKAFFNYRKKEEIFSCCIDTDWGIGVISKKKNLGSKTLVENQYYDFAIFKKNRKESLNLISYDDFKERIK